MVNAKRLYVYGVLGAALVLLLWGLTSILRMGGTRARGGPRLSRRRWRGRRAR